MSWGWTNLVATPTTNFSTAPQSPQSELDLSTPNEEISSSQIAAMPTSHTITPAQHNRSSWSSCSSLTSRLTIRIGTMRSSCSSKLQHLTTVARKKGSIFHLTCLGLFATLFFGGLGLRLAFDQQHFAWETAKLAEWTARKDFREICQDQAVSRPQLVRSGLG